MRIQGSLANSRQTFLHNAIQQTKKISERARLQFFFFFFAVVVALAVLFPLDFIICCFRLDCGKTVPYVCLSKTQCVYMTTNAGTLQYENNKKNSPVNNRKIRKDKA
uniref:Uncharacterized protein n=1 Tax=Trypanosoma vivax (strain Y486) TaxID=1055687 RepID=G0TZ68_TRYVY|nr:hypothetical protein, unlikely [Trypanosoma vivax Y486]